MLMLMLIKSLRGSSSPDIVGPNVCVIQSDDLNAHTLKKYKALLCHFLSSLAKKGIMMSGRVVAMIEK